MRDGQWQEFIDRLVNERFGTNAALARHLHQRESTVSRWRRGITKQPDPETVKEVLEALKPSGQSLGDLLREAWGMDVEEAPREQTLEDMIAAYFQDPKNARLALSLIASLKQEDQAPPPPKGRKSAAM